MLFVIVVIIYGLFVATYVLSTLFLAMAIEAPVILSILAAYLFLFGLKNTWKIFKEAMQIDDPEDCWYLLFLAFNCQYLFDLEDDWEQEYFQKNLDKQEPTEMTSKFSTTLVIY